MGTKREITNLLQAIEKAYWDRQQFDGLEGLDDLFFQIIQQLATSKDANVRLIHDVITLRRIITGLQGIPYDGPYL